ncbi:hypothetical protein [Peribacillus glennii]|uniref:hypothetical protein n=1 Tax=Peribacillus glennii TaxID=2303991 RepID=UPI001F2B0333|nr:hypothetical protein [Peribacillus glennii]
MLGGCIHHHFQSLWTLSEWRVYGYEVLLYYKDFENPEERFYHARKNIHLYELGTLFILKAIEAFPFLPEKDVV